MEFLEGVFNRRKNPEVEQDPKQFALERVELFRQNRNQQPIPGEDRGQDDIVNLDKYNPGTIIRTTFERVTKGDSSIINTGWDWYCLSVKDKFYRILFDSPYHRVDFILSSDPRFKVELEEVSVYQRTFFVSNLEVALYGQGDYQRSRPIDIFYTRWEVMQSGITSKVKEPSSERTRLPQLVPQLET